jgi:voltage-gated potassium channel
MGEARLTRVRRLQQRTHEILEATLPEDRAARVAGTAIVALIILNIAALCLETVKPVHEAAPAFFHWFEVVSVAVFSTEYVLRLWSCTASPAYAEPFRGRLRYALRPMAIVDLLSVLPFYLPTELDLRFGRVFRVFRLLKLGRYSEALRTFGRVFRARKEELVVTLTVLTILLIIASSLMYYAEKEVQPDTFSSIPASMWWAVVTLTTVGYGDIYPKTDIGRVLGGIIAICGIGMFALPTGILGSAFMEEIQALRKRFDKCPHCGKDLSA